MIVGVLFHHQVGECGRAGWDEGEEFAARAKAEAVHLGDDIELVAVVRKSGTRASP